MASWTIGASGADYTDIRAAEDDTNPSGAQSGDTLLLFDEAHGAAGGGTLDNGKIFTIQPDVGAEHDGVSNTSGARIAWDTAAEIWHQVTVTCNDIVVIPNAGTRAMLYDEGSTRTATFTRCVVDAGGTEFARINVNTVQLDMTNCVVHSLGGTYGLVRSGDAFSANLTHCVIHASGDALRLSNTSSTWTLKACAVYGGSGSTFFQAGNATVTADDCVFSDDASGSIDSGSGNQHSVTFTTSTASSAAIYTNLTAGSEDFTPVDHANNVLLGAATADVVTDDIIGTSRTEAADDVGPFELIAGGGGGGQHFLPSHIQRRAILPLLRA